MTIERDLLMPGHVSREWLLRLLRVAKSRGQRS
jgi:hypothetical protein